MAFPVINPILQFFDNSGEVLSGGLLYTYAPGTTTPKTTWSDENLSVANANPIVLDSAGRCTIFLTDGEEYKFVLQTSAGVTVRTVDEVKSPAALTSASVGAALYPRTAAEIAAGITPTNYNYPERNVLRYGTNTTQGTTDMLTAFTSAVAVAKAQPLARGTVYVPNGDYYVSGQITLDTPGLWLVGESMYTTRILGNTAGNYHIVEIDVVSGPPTGVMNIAIGFEGGNSNQDCLVVDNGNGVFIDHVWTVGGRYGARVDAGSDHVHLTNVVSELCATANFYITQCHDIKLANCLSYASQVNGFVLFDSPTVTGTNHTRQVMMVNCSDTESDNVGILCEDFDDIVMVNCVVHAFSGQEPTEGIRADNCDRVQISNCAITHTDLYGINIVDCDGVHINNVLIDAVGNYASIPAAASYGILATTSANVIVNGGQISNSAGYGVRYVNTGGKIIGTSIVNPCQKASATNGLIGLRVTDGSPNIIIDGVSVVGNSVASSTGISIETTAVVQGANNRVTGFTTNFSGSGGYVHQYLRGIGINDTPQTLTGAGAVSLTTDVTWVVTTGANALTLGDGYEGQRKWIVMKTDGGTGTLTPDDLYNGTTITFDDVGDSADLLYTDGQWVFMGGTATLA